MVPKLPLERKELLEGWDNFHKLNPNPYFFLFFFSLTNSTLDPTPSFTPLSNQPCKPTISLLVET
jgi:hypothetical protein